MRVSKKSTELPQNKGDLLEGNGVLDVDVAQDFFSRQPLQLGVELGDAVLRQQEEQVQAQELVLVG